MTEIKAKKSAAKKASKELKPLVWPENFIEKSPVATGLPFIDFTRDEAWLLFDYFRDAKIRLTGRHIAYFSPKFFQKPNIQWLKVWAGEYMEDHKSYFSSNRSVIQLQIEIQNLQQAHDSLFNLHSQQALANEKKSEALDLRIEGLQARIIELEQILDDNEIEYPIV